MRRHRRMGIPACWPQYARRARHCGLSLGFAHVTDAPSEILFERRAVLLSNVTREMEWREIQPLDRIGSWLGLPLIAAGDVLGILSLGAYAPDAFVHEHLRLAKSLAVAAAVAIKNARVHERAEIYASELQLNLTQLRDTQLALDHAESRISRPSNT